MDPSNKTYQPLLKYSKYEKEGQLYDALATGCNLPYASHSIKYYDDEVAKDIMYLVESNPELLGFKDGTLRCRHNVTPLAMACFNENIPTYIINFLLSKGANPHDTINFNGYECDLLEDLKICLEESPDRLSEIERIFEKYRTTEVHSNTS